MKDWLLKTQEQQNSLFHALLEESMKSLSELNIEQGTDISVRVIFGKKSRRRV